MGSRKAEALHEYRQLARVAHKAYDETFWNEEAGRYVGCVDIDGVAHDYGYTFVNMQALAFGLGDETKARRIYDWMETGLTSSGEADAYSRWVFAPRASTFHNPPVSAAQEPLPSWWFWGWLGTPFEAQCQDGGAILYTSYDDVMARLRYFSPDNAWERFTTIVDRYAEPDHLSGGAPLFRGEDPQGGPGGHAGSVGVEGEFPESGIVPCLWLYGFVGAQPTVEGLKIRPKLPRALEWAGVRGIAYAGGTLNLEVTPELLTYSFLRGDTKREEVVQIPRGQACLLKPDGSFELVSAFDNWP